MERENATELGCHVSNNVSGIGRFDLISVNRRCLIKVVGLSISTVSGCLGSRSASSDSPAQSGSGNPCTNPRNIDYDAVGEYRDHGVYLKNIDDRVHTACVTVTKENRSLEEANQSSPPPLSHKGYEIHPGRIVEIFTFDEPGHYMIEVSIEETTTTEEFTKTEADFDAGSTTIYTFEITSASRVQLTQNSAS